QPCRFACPCFHHDCILPTVRFIVNRSALNTAPTIGNGGSLAGETLAGNDGNVAAGELGDGGIRDERALPQLAERKLSLCQQVLDGPNTHGKQRRRLLLGDQERAGEAIAAEILGITVLHGGLLFWSG